jgi:hypothetical protein
MGAFGATIGVFVGAIAPGAKWERVPSGSFRGGVTSGDGFTLGVSLRY